jgi:hypothetical protein
LKPEETIILKVITSNEESTRSVYQHQIHTCKQNEETFASSPSLSHANNAYTASAANLTTGLGNQ